MEGGPDEGWEGRGGGTPELEASGLGAFVFGGFCCTLDGGGREGGGRDVMGEAKSPNSSSWSSREEG